MTRAANAHPRSAAAAEYRRLYKTSRWQRLRERHLSDHPLCARCLAMGIVEPATVVHHGEGGHKGDIDKFFDPDILESLCKSHHDSEGQREDLGQTIVTFGADGWPTDN